MHVSPEVRFPVEERSVGFLLGELSDELSIPRAAVAVEEAGAAAFWVVDHLLWHRPMPECLAAVAMAAAVTSRCAVGPCVLQVPLRGAVEVVKASSFIHHATGGRFVLGVGVGEHRGEYERVGAAFEERGKALERFLDTIDRLVGSSDDGRYRLDPAGRFPIWVGGRSEVAVRRAARRADGWIPHFVTPEELSARRQVLMREAERAGRDPGEITVAATVFVSAEDSEEAHRQNLSRMARLFALPEKALAKRLLAGSVDDVARGVEAYFDSGARHVALMVMAGDPVDRFAEVCLRLA